ncbi:MAG: hypothetical protein HC822_00630 [Oscillochloris sp.]|nr:hypothetical protein [Oscillochloris sp.]
MITVEQQQRIRELLSDTGYEVGALLVLLTNTDGHPISSWSRLSYIDAEHVALLSAASTVARVALVEQLGARSSYSSIVQEYDDHTLLVLHLGYNLALVVAFDDTSRLGWVRMVARRAGRMIYDTLIHSSA